MEELLSAETEKYAKELLEFLTALMERPDFYPAAAAALALALTLNILLYFFRVSRKLKLLAKNKSQDGEGEEGRFSKLELDVKTGINDFTQVELERLKAEMLRQFAELKKPAPAGETPPPQNEAVEELRGQLEKMSLYLHDEFAAAAAKMEKRPETPAADNTAVLEMLNQSMNRLSAEVDAKLTMLDGKLEKNMESRWTDAMSSVNALREQIEKFSGAGEQIKNLSQDMASLSRLMSARVDTDERGARRQLSELLAQILSAEHFALDVGLPGGHSAAAMVRFPDPKDSVAIDAGLPLEAFIKSLDETLPAPEREAQRKTFAGQLESRINHTADNLINPPHTGESALLFVASEAAFSEIHVRHRSAVNLALSRRVWLVSPTTLLAVINTANTAIRDHEARIQLQHMQEAAAQIVEEARHFENRLSEIGDHVNSAWRSVQRAETASGRLIGNIRGISRGENPGVPPPPPSAPSSSNDDS